MDDQEFIQNMQKRIEDSAGVAITLELDNDQREDIDVFFSGEKPRVVIGADALVQAGLARMFMQFAILCLKEGRKVEQEEFLWFLRRN
ncbi:MAG: hypothetical protein FI703_00210 [SAR202 cluster bacterium]|nr:hypothetical protein [SAR202 cluster bacterium]